MAAPFVDFTPVLAMFDMASQVELTFSRLSPVSPGFVDGRIKKDTALFEDFVLDPLGYAVVPRAPKEFLQQLTDALDRQRARLLVWTYATVDLEAQLRTIEQTTHARADRCTDVTRGHTYVAEKHWAYPRQSGISGVIFVLLDQ